MLVKRKKQYEIYSTFGRSLLESTYQCHLSTCSYLPKVPAQVRHHQEQIDISMFGIVFSSQWGLSRVPNLVSYMLKQTKRETKIRIQGQIFGYVPDKKKYLFCHRLTVFVIYSSKQIPTHDMSRHGGGEGHSHVQGNIFNS